MAIVHECKCGLATPLPDARGGRRIRCQGCGTIAVVVVPEVLTPDPVPAPVPAGPPDTTPAPPPPRAHRYRRRLTPEEERADYPRTGGVIDWRRVHEGDEFDYHHDPIPPDPQTRYLRPDVNLGGRFVRIFGGGLMVVAAGVFLLAGLVAFGRVPYIALIGAAGLFAAGCGVMARGLFRRYG